MPLLVLFTRVPVAQSLTLSGHTRARLNSSVTHAGIKSTDTHCGVVYTKTTARIISGGE